MDLFCFATSFIVLIYWYLSNSVLIAHLLTILIDAVGSAPTLKKAFLRPRSENLFSWIMFIIGDLINFFVLPNFSIESVSYPIYLTLLAVSMTTIIIVRRSILNPD